MQRLYDSRKPKKPPLATNCQKRPPRVAGQMRRTLRRSRGCRTCRGRKYAHNLPSHTTACPADPALESNATKKSRPAYAAVEASCNAKATMNSSSLMKAQDWNAEHQGQLEALPRDRILRCWTGLSCRLRKHIVFGFWSKS
jgi:hypothetical protein